MVEEKKQIQESPQEYENENWKTVFTQLFVFYLLIFLRRFDGPLPAGWMETRCWRSKFTITAKFSPTGERHTSLKPHSPQQCELFVVSVSFLPPYHSLWPIRADTVCVCVSQLKQNRHWLYSPESVVWIDSIVCVTNCKPQSWPWMRFTSAGWWR